MYNTYSIYIHTYILYKNGGSNYVVIYISYDILYLLVINNNLQNTNKLEIRQQILALLLSEREGRTLYF